MRVRLTRKLAREIDGIDLSNHDVGDVFELSDRMANLLMREGWAVAEPASRVLEFTRGNVERDDQDDLSRAS